MASHAKENENAQFTAIIKSKSCFANSAFVVFRHRGECRKLSPVAAELLYSSYEKEFDYGNSVIGLVGVRFQ